MKTVHLAVKTAVLRGFSGSKPWNGAKSKKLAKPMSTSDKKKSYLARLCQAPDHAIWLNDELVLDFDLSYIDESKSKTQGSLERFGAFSRKKTDFGQFHAKSEKKITLLTTRRSGHENTQIRSASQYNP